MPVDNKHADYIEALPVWTKIDAMVAGPDAVRDNGELFVPKLKGQQAGEYREMLQRGVFLNATGRTHEAFVGMITRKPIAITDKTGLLADFIGNADGHGVDFQTLCQAVISGIVRHNRAVTLIDWTRDRRPYLTTYSAKQMINWGAGVDDKGKPFLEFVVLHEYAQEYRKFSNGPELDKYQTSGYEQLRELRKTSDGVTSELFRKNKDDEWVSIEQRSLDRLGLPLPGLPVVIHSGSANGPYAIEPSILVDLMEVNAGHFRNSIDLETGLHWCGNPTPYAQGFGDIKELALGPSSALITSNVNAKCGYMEFSGAGLKAIADAMKEKREDMAAIGARVLQARQADAEAYTTAALRARGETAALVTIVSQATRSLSQVMQWAAWVKGTEVEPQALADKVYAVVSKDMVAKELDPQAMNALVAALQASAISYEVFFHNLEKGEILPEGTTLEEEQQRIEAAAMNAAKRDAEAFKLAAAAAGTNA